MKIAIIGTGYVGLVTGVVLAHLGNDVVCVDRDAAKLDQIRRGESPIYEPGLQELIRRTLDDGYLRVSGSIPDSVRESEIVFIAVGTPPAADGTPDLSTVRTVACEIAKGIERYTLVVNKSTVPVGGGDFVESLIAEAGVAPELFDVVSNPEFLREGSAVRDTLEPDRVVVGAANPRAAERVAELYAPLKCPVLKTDRPTAELIKYASNSFLALKVSYINALSRICEACGADIGGVAEGMGADARIGAPFLQAGLGWGGSCFPKDVQGMIATADRFGYDFELLRQVVEINDAQTMHALDRLEARLGGFEGKTVALLGLAFKANTDDIRDAKSLAIMERIFASGGHVRAHDPVAMENVRPRFPQAEYLPSPYDAAAGADALLVVTEWNEFKQLDLARLAATLRMPVVFDGRRIYARQNVEAAGLEYFTVGELGPGEARSARSLGAEVGYGLR